MNRGGRIVKKLTLSLDKDLIHFAHTYSRHNDISVSKLFEQYLLQLQSKGEKQELDPKTQLLYGAFERDPIPNKEELRKGFYEKDTH
jgi:hypothetical protein